MAYRQDWIRLIRQLAQRYGVDPQAALAVASQEGLGGGVGDQGTSYGAFQLHRGGALPAGRDQAWAESPQGLDYALRQIGGVSKGLHGNQAIQAIVSRFERPKDAQGEIARAIQAYSQFGGAAQAGGPRPLSLPPQGAAASAPDPRQSILRTLASGRDVDFVGLARQAMLQRQQPAATPTAPQAAPVGRGYAGKIIGTPGSGTHTLGNWESDRAYDEAEPVGTPVRAPFDGVIGSQFGSLGEGGRFAGLRVHVVGQKDEAYLAHLSKFAQGIKPGTRVRAGQIIGYSGSANGVAHLHEALRRGNPRSLVPLT